MASIFTKIINREIPSTIVWENDEFIAFLDISPMRPGHTLVCPKKEVDYLFDLDPETYRGLWDAVKTVSAALKKATGAKRIGVAVEGFLVPHVHVHLVPINDHDDFMGLKSEEQNAEALKVMAEKIENAL
jgi:histidine triad (HIT) family protein